MDVKLVTFPETRVASITHIGSSEQEHITARKLIDWKIKNHLFDQAKYRSYGLHYFDPLATDPLIYRVDFCLSFDGGVEQNDDGIFEQVIPRLRCAFARDIGSRTNNQAVIFLIEKWLPSSNETPSGFPIIFHYVNVGPNVQEHQAITDVYLSLK
jgi:AraC family transcriptional regulator